jgi:hypothetical protein
MIAQASQYICNFRDVTSGKERTCTIVLWIGIAQGNSVAITAMMLDEENHLVPMPQNARIFREGE